MDGVITEKDYPIQGLWVFKPGLGSIFVSIIFVPIFLLSHFAETSQNAEIDFSMVVIPGGLAIFYLLFSVLRRTTFHYVIGGQFLTLRQGILSRQQRHIPYGVIQNLFVKQDLFDKIFGLASLTIENASQGAGALKAGVRRGQQMEMVGFSGNKVGIPGLTKQNAETLKEIVLQKMKENPIEDSQSGL